MKVTDYFFPAGISMHYAIIADYHDRDPIEITESLNKRKPDGILIVGDLVDRSSVTLLESTIWFLHECSSIAPTFYSFGNHERMLLSSDLITIKSQGIRILDNEWIELERCVIGGLSTDARQTIKDKDRIEFRKNTLYRRNMSLWQKRKHISNDMYTYRVHHYDMPELEWLNEFEKNPKYKILLCHHPEYYERYLQNRKIDLILSGHAHGGQICLFGRGLYASGQGLFPRYTSGIYDNRLVISRGLSNTLRIIPRVFNPKELVYIHL